MATQVIQILRGYPNGDLDLSDNGHTRANRLDKVIWQIRKHSGVVEIDRIEEKGKSYNIFEPGHPYEQGNHWRGDISDDAPDDARYRYSIFWRAMQNGPVLEHDPIISIRPSTGGGHVAKVVIMAVATFALVFFTLQYLDRRKKKNNDDKR